MEFHDLLLLHGDDLHPFPFPFPFPCYLHRIPYPSYHDVHENVRGNDVHVDGSHGGHDDHDDHDGHDGRDGRDGHALGAPFLQRLNLD